MRVERVGSDVRLHPSGPIRGSVRPPGSKSLTNRYLLCAALADGRSTLREPSLSDDVECMLAGLRRLGVAADVHEDPSRLVVHGCNGYLPADDADIDAGDAGTVMRFLTALAATGHGRYRLDGSRRMRERPIGQLVDALRALGAGVGYEATEGYPPVTILARGLLGGEVRFTGPPSSQFISALLMAAPYAAQDVYLSLAGPLPSRPYVAMTVQVMRSMGVELLEGDGPRFIVPAGQRYRAGEYFVEPDASAATYFWAAAAVTGGCVQVCGLRRNSLQGDVRFVDVLDEMGCRVREGPDFLEVSGPVEGRLHGVDVDLNAMPDTVQTLAVAALFADGTTRIRNVANLRIKETDRIAALATELSRLGARVDAKEDGLSIHPPAQVTPAAIRTYRDHRMAMSFALAGLVVDGLSITDADCVSKSFPAFFEVLDGLR